MFYGPCSILEHMEHMTRPESAFSLSTIEHLRLRKRAVSNEADHLASNLK